MTLSQVSQIDKLRRQLLFGASGLLLLASCSDPQNQVTFNFRVTLYFDENGAERAASSVARLTMRERPRGGIGDQFGYGFTGESVIVDFGDLGHVFALPRNENSRNSYPTGVLLNELGGGFGSMEPDRKAVVFKTIPSNRNEVIVPRNEWPTLVRFDDLGKPSSVQELDPSNVFPGKGRIVLKRVVLQVSDDPVTSVLLDFLPWLSTHKGTLSGRNVVSRGGSIGDRLYPGYFKAGA